MPPRAPEMLDSAISVQNGSNDLYAVKSVGILVRRLFADLVLDYPETGCGT